MTEPIAIERRRARILAALPDMCATILPSTYVAIVIKRGHAGHWPLPDGMTIERTNAVFDASPPRIEAMLIGSICGWDVPDADTARYNPHGGPRRS